MVFSSLLFIFIYLVVTLALYYAVPNRVYRNVILCVLSLIFYGWGEPSFVLLMIFSIAFNWLAGLLVGKYRNNKKRCKAVLVASVVLNLALLGVFKYTGFVVDTLKAVFPFMRSYATPIIPLPIGISFYTFQAMSYVIDVYRNDTSVQKNPVYFGTYVALFPQLIAGPIVRYRDIADQLENRHENVAQFASGIKLFTVGLAKKVLLANQLIALWNVLRESSATNGVLGSWVGIIAYTLHIYFDFGGYSDMAIGLGRMFGFEFLKNFDYPYISRSISEFWRRWHISLSTWFREYVYIPLGGNRLRAPCLTPQSFGCSPDFGTVQAGISCCGECISGLSSLSKNCSSGNILKRPPHSFPTCMRYSFSPSDGFCSTSRTWGRCVISLFRFSTAAVSA